MKKLLNWWEGVSIDLGYAWTLFQTLQKLRRERKDLSFFPRVHLAIEAMRQSTIYAQTQMAIKYGKADD